MTESTILIGVDGSERSEDAIAFGGRIAAASGAQVIVACAFRLQPRARLRRRCATPRSTPPTR